MPGYSADGDSPCGELVVSADPFSTSPDFESGDICVICDMSKGEEGANCVML